LLGDLPSLALALMHLGDTEDAIDNPDAARNAYRSANALQDRLTPNRADRIRRRLLERFGARQVRPAGR
jgi:hypothetical protein